MWWTGEGIPQGVYYCIVTGGLSTNSQCCLVTALFMNSNWSGITCTISFAPLVLIPSNPSTSSKEETKTSIPTTFLLLFKLFVKLHKKLSDTRSIVLMEGRNRRWLYSSWQISHIVTFHYIYTVRLLACNNSFICKLEIVSNPLIVESFFMLAFSLCSGVAHFVRSWGPERKAQPRSLRGRQSNHGRVRAWTGYSLCSFYSFHYRSTWRQTWCIQ